ncbi:alpha/beta fold hydrolase [Rhodobacter calidifons]|uniref:Alpha/beta fold hydrolase n=1 Tax=Rhodobacter calidifons TaxID=2715277 RepID=A0ABX0G3N5_9RHOB|nr:alpha/beta hydrolase [Rhodobacter calidifons]NHB75481.1 alpha/beta fold hydrolase [Rhodobacter calidifons]
MTQPLHFPAADGARLAYRDEGAGLPLLCLPGLTRTMADFDYLIPHLPPLRLIRMDYRGRGASDWTGAATYTVAQEAQDALALLDHLGVARAAILGTSRGGLIGMVLGATARDRLSGLILNDVGPEIARDGLTRIFDYVGRNPAGKTHEGFAELLSRTPGFSGVPMSRWLDEARKHAVETPQGLRIPYDPALREAFLAAFEGPPVDLWPLFDALAGLPLALIRGANSDLLAPETVAQMRARRPDMAFAEVPDRAHIPFLDEPPAVDLIRRFLAGLG